MHELLVLIQFLSTASDPPDASQPHAVCRNRPALVRDLETKGYQGGRTVRPKEGGVFEIFRHLDTSLLIVQHHDDGMSCYVVMPGKKPNSGGDGPSK